MTTLMSSEKQTLSNLTPRVLALLRETEDGFLDLSTAETQLGINKRRLYDIVNVLAGIGVVERSGKAKIRLCKQNDDPPEPLSVSLQEREQQIDELGHTLDAALAELPFSQDYAQYAYVTPEDIGTINSDPRSTVFYLKGTRGMTIEFADDESGHQMICRDASGPIQLMRLSEYNLRFCL